jgi:putative thioredoxin
LDPDQALAKAAADETDLAAQLDAADIELVIGKPEAAFERLLGLIRTRAGRSGTRRGCGCLSCSRRWATQTSGC